MMGYTHAAIGAAGALALVTLCGGNTPEMYLIASIAGALGGIVVDSDAHDSFKNPKVTDAGRTRLAVIGLVAIGVVVDLVLHMGILMSIISRGYFALGGVIAFLALAITGYFTPHRTFTHSLLYVVLTSTSVFFVYPEATIYFITGSLLHLIFDMLNFPYNNHGVWLLYPIKTGKGIAFGLCKSARKGNKICYFIGIIAFAAVSAVYLWNMRDLMKSIAPAIIIVYMGVVMHFVRWKSEKEQRHIMHIRMEI